MAVLISTVILAGGLGTRIGGDKALQLLQGRPLLDWVLEAVAPQSDEVLVSANGNLAAYARYGCRVVPDQLAGYAGPLAGLQAALMLAQGEWLASVPCDVPFLPHDSIERLHAACCAQSATAAVAVAGGRNQPAIALYRRSMLPQLNAYLAAGGRKVAAWQDSLPPLAVPFAEAAAFVNINSAQQLAQADRILLNGGTHDDVFRALA